MKRRDLTGYGERLARAASLGLAWLEGQGQVSMQPSDAGESKPAECDLVAGAFGGRARP